MFNILFVVDCDTVALLDVSKLVRGETLNLSRTLGCKVDLLVLTPTEFAEKPLKNMHELQKIEA